MERQKSYADPDRAIRRYYRRRWQAMLEVLLDWPIDRAQQWASYEIDTHRGAGFPLAHEHAAYWLLEVFTRDVPPENRQSGQLKADVIGAIHDSEPLWDAPDDEVRAWLAAARPRLAAALKFHGGELPTFDPARDGW
jgi:hypothetical protein